MPSIIANELDIPLLYISTAGIFDGAQETYDDWDQPNPLGHYARSKYMGERFVAENGRRHLVCRAGWMMGGGPGQGQEVHPEADGSSSRTARRELYVVDDKLGTPTYTRDFARNVELLLEKEFWGIYNMVCAGVTSRLEVAQYLVEALGLADEVKITPVSSDYFAAEYFAARPASERLLTTKLDLRGLNIMRDWRTCLEEYLADAYVGLSRRSRLRRRDFGIAAEVDHPKLHREVIGETGGERDEAEQDRRRHARATKRRNDRVMDQVDRVRRRAEKDQAFRGMHRPP